MTEYIYIYISHPPVSEGNYPHSLNPTLFWGVYPCHQFGEGKSHSATLLRGLNWPDNVFFAHIPSDIWTGSQVSPSPERTAQCRVQNQTAGLEDPNLGLKSAYDIPSTKWE